MLDMEIILATVFAVIKTIARTECIYSRDEPAHADDFGFSAVVCWRRTHSTGNWDFFRNVVQEFHIYVLASFSRCAWWWGVARSRHGQIRRVHHQIAYAIVTWLVAALIISIRTMI